MKDIQQQYATREPVLSLMYLRLENDKLGFVNMSLRYPSQGNRNRGKSDIEQFMIQCHLRASPMLLRTVA